MVTDEDLQRMGSEELFALGARIGLDMIGARTRNGLLRRILMSAKEIVNY